MEGSGLEGRIAIVTGGTRGVGHAIVCALVDSGCRVITCARNEPADFMEDVECAQIDVRDSSAVEAFVGGVVQKHGRIDILVNNAGGSPPSEAAKASPRFGDAIVALNLLAPYYFARACHAPMQAGGGGAIINIASISGQRPSPGTTMYGAAKAGLLHMTKSLAQEWGADGIRVNAIALGLATTADNAENYGDAAAQERIARSLPLGRMATGEDVADAVRYFASAQSAYVSGACLNVDGGGERPLFLDLVKGG